MIQDICSVADAMSWLACAAEVKNFSKRALNAREEIYRRLLKDNKDIAQHFRDVSLSLIKQRNQ